MRCFIRPLAIVPLIAMGVACGARAADCSYSALGYKEMPLQGGQPVNLCQQFGGKVALIVNTATASPRAAQLRDLESLYKKYKDQGFVVLAFPSNDFDHEPKKGKALAEEMKHKYGVDYPVFSPIHVTGPKTDYLYRNLFFQAGIPPSRDFDKYIVGRNGEIVGYYSSTVTTRDASFVTVIKDQLSRPAP